MVVKSKNNVCQSAANKERPKTDCLTICLSMKPLLLLRWILGKIPQNTIKKIRKVIKEPSGMQEGSPLTLNA